MKKASRHNPIGTLPMDKGVCAMLQDKQGNMICEAYMYRVGFFRFNWHPSLEIMFVMQGNLRIFTQHGTYLLKEGDIIVLQPNEGHATMMETGDTIAAVMHISQKYLEGISSSAQHIRCLYDSSKERDISYFRIRNAFASFYRTASSETSLGSQIYAESQLMMVIGTLMMYFASEPTARIASGLTPQQSRKFNKILMQIDKNYRQECTLKTLAEAVDMSPCYLSSYFKKHMMMGFHEYLTRKRLAQAVYELNNSDNTVLEIAVNAGFPDAKGLYAAFQQYFGMTPNDYRRKIGTHMDANAKNYVPIRLPFQDPFVQRKLEEYSKER